MTDITPDDDSDRVAACQTDCAGTLCECVRRQSASEKCDVTYHDCEDDCDASIEV